MTKLSYRLIFCTSARFFCLFFTLLSTFAISYSPQHSTKVQTITLDSGISSTQINNTQLGPAPGTYQIETNHDHLVIPFEYLGMNLMIDAKMNGEKIKMLIDNGVMWDDLLFYGSEQVDKLGLKYEMETDSVTGSGDDQSKATEANTASDATLSFGDVTFFGQSSVIMPKDSGWAEMFEGAVGQVCGAFFKHFVVEFDFNKSNMILHKPQNYRYQGKGTALKMTRNQAGSYSVPVKIKLKGKPAFDYQIFIDLGGIDYASLVIGGEHKIEKPNSAKIYLGHGASGEINGYRENIESFIIGGYQLREMPTIFTESQIEANHTDTTIGLPLLRRFNLVFDYFNEVLYLEPNKSFAKHYEKEMVLP